MQDWILPNRSINAEVNGENRKANIKIKYHSPGGQRAGYLGRIWCRMDKIWVTGAHMATSLESDKDFMIKKTLIPKGKYALFTILKRTIWTVIINKEPQSASGR
jgi:hypothetical protein